MVDAIIQSQFNEAVPKTYRIHNIQLNYNYFFTRGLYESCIIQLILLYKEIHGIMNKTDREEQKGIRDIMFMLHQDIIDSRSKRKPLVWGQIKPIDDWSLRLAELINKYGLDVPMKDDPRFTR